MQPEQGLDLAGDFAAGRFGFEHLPQETFAGEPQVKDAVAAVRPMVLSGEQRGGQQVAQVFLKLAQSGLAEGVGGPAAQSGQAGAEGGEVRS